MKKVVLSRLAVVAMLVSAAFVVSCNKDEDEGKDGKVQLLETVSNDGILELKYEYDEQNRISKLILYKADGKNVHNTRTFGYDQAGDLVSITDADGDKYSFKKEGNKIIINDDEQDDEEYLELNGQGLPVKWVQEDSNGSDIITMEYDNGNLGRWYSSESYSSEGHTYTNDHISAFTYDDKKSPYYNCKTPMWAFVWEDDLGFLDQEGTNKNNLLAIYDDKDTPSRSFTYIYDDNDFPTTINVKWEDDGDTRTYTLTYITK